MNQTNNVYILVQDKVDAAVSKVKHYLSQYRSSDTKLSARESSQKGTEVDCPRETIVYEMLDRLHLEEPSGSVPERLTSLTERRGKEASFGHATPAGTSSDTLAGTPQIPHTLPSRGTTPRPAFTETPGPDPQRNQGDGRNSNPWYTWNAPNPMTGLQSIVLNNCSEVQIGQHNCMSVQPRTAFPKKEPAQFGRGRGW